MRQYNLLDRFIENIDRTFGFLNGSHKQTRPNPALTCPEPALSPKQIKHTIALMRINHAGEIAAQGLYQGQALTANLTHTRAHMKQAAQEEIDHLTWCQERLKELGGRTSYLDPAWYCGALLIGAIAGAAGDRWSLGFIAETEKQVSAHLQCHLEQINPQDQKTKNILRQMQIDEEQHATNALDAGGNHLPHLIQMLMRLASKLMVKTAYYF